MLGISDERAFALAAHPDDIEFVVAGTAAKWARAGTAISYVLATSGDAGSHVPGITREEVARIREEEQRAAARIAGIMAAKRTADIIPMCHPLLLTSIKTDIEDMPELPGFKLFVTAKLNGQTGVEMEALSGVGIGLLTIYDMLKAIDKSMVINDIRLESKSGGKSGNFKRGEK